MMDSTGSRRLVTTERQGRRAIGASRGSQSGWFTDRTFHANPLLLEA
jgi:hypothetical protein